MVIVLGTVFPTLTHAAVFDSVTNAGTYTADSRLISSTNSQRWKSSSTSTLNYYCSLIGSLETWTGSYKLSLWETNGFPTYTFATELASSTISASGYGDRWVCFDFDAIQIENEHTYMVNMEVVSGNDLNWRGKTPSPSNSLYVIGASASTWVGSTFFFTAGDTPYSQALENDTLGVSLIAEPSEDFDTIASTTIPIQFLYYLDTEDNYTQYVLSLYNHVTGAYTNATGTLSSTATGAHIVQNATTTVPNAGTYTLTIGIKKPNQPFSVTVGRTYDVTFNAVSQSVVAPPPAGINNTYASTSCAINFLGTFSLSECMSYLFIPSSNIYSLYGNIPTILGTKFPFSYITSVQDTWKGLNNVAGEAPVLEYNLHDIGIGSTTPLGNFLPNFEIFSEETISTYLPPTILDLFKGLVATVLVLLTFLNIYSHSMRLLRNT